LIRKKITVVIPVYNEEKAFAKNFNVILGYFDAIQDVDINVIIVNDGSADDTEGAVQGFCESREDVSLISFTRNFGKEAAMQAGLDNATGDAVIVMDSDLQHPPELVSQMIAKWREGACIVEAHKSSRGRESILSRFFAKSFYRIFNNLSGLDLRNQCDFKLLDRLVVDAYKALPEKGHFFRGIVKWLGYPAVQIPFEVPERSYGGTSSWSRLRLARFSISAITSFSAVPLQFVTLLGLVTFSISIFFGAIAVYKKMMGSALDGFTTVILLILIIGSILMFSFGLMGMYIARIYEEIKSRPSYVLKPSQKRLD
jgi:dolichol-phosphate mannosyltransferase